MWEVVRPRQGRLPAQKRKSTVSVIRTGKGRLSLSLTKGFKERFSGVDYVEIKIDRERGLLLVEPSEYEEGEVFKITRTKSGTYIHCTHALRLLGVQPGRYRARWDDVEGGLIVEFGPSEEERKRPIPEDEAFRILYEPDDWGPGTEDTSRRIDEILYGG